MTSGRRTDPRVDLGTAGLYGRAAEEGSKQFERLVESVDFPTFVSSLIKGVFKAIVDSSIEQMQAYQELVSSVVASTADLTGGISDEQASAFLMADTRGRVNVKAGGSGSSHEVSTTEGSEDDPELKKKLGLSADADLTDDESVQAMLINAKLKMAQQKQQMLATMVMMGINRIVITNGRINAKVLMSVSAVENTSTSKEIDSDFEASQKSSLQVGGWGAKAKHQNQTKLSVQSAYSNDKDDNLQTKASLSGEVDLKFKSETFPLELMAPPESISRIQDTAKPGTPA